MGSYIGLHGFLTINIRRKNPRADLFPYASHKQDNAVSRLNISPPNPASCVSSIEFIAQSDVTAL